MDMHNAFERLIDDIATTVSTELDQWKSVCNSSSVMSTVVTENWSSILTTKDK